ncbi:MULTISPECIES: hypothetical protein [unclassified Legionella]|uniref:hypothetical protein n=1 Tax=unclassified Legionella TaxID=2622702 RepID=UPI001E31098E|nr:hypothetical protein [Legionella sp. 31fI33]MCC5015891.1 hypothetical protein [Legionella sp. 31fI33]
MFDLIQLWKNISIESAPVPQPVTRSYAPDTKPGAINFDTNTAQSSFQFKKSPNVVFVKSVKTLAPANLYDDLPAVTLTDEEETARLLVVEEQKKKNPKFYDGQQMVITGVVYDEVANTVYMEAKRVPYSFIVALSSKKFPEQSELYKQSFFKTGVLAPLVTTNGKTVLMQRVQLGLYSVPGGFLEAHDVEKRLNFADGRNLVVETAKSEVTEEIAGIAGKKELRFDFSEPEITALSFRRTAGNPIGTVEFVAPVQAKCHSAYISECVIPKNLAKDAREHSTNHAVIPLDSQDREALLTTLLSGPGILPGAVLHLPVVLSLASKENAGAMIPLPRRIPNSGSIAWPLSIFSAKPEKPLPLIHQEEEVNDTGFNLIS